MRSDRHSSHNQRKQRAIWTLEQAGSTVADPSGRTIATDTSLDALRTLADEVYALVWLGYRWVQAVERIEHHHSVNRRISQAAPARLTQRTCWHEAPANVHERLAFLHPTLAQASRGYAYGFGVWMPSSLHPGVANGTIAAG